MIGRRRIVSRVIIGHAIIRTAGRLAKKSMQVLSNRAKIWIISGVIASSSRRIVACK